MRMSESMSLINFCTSHQVILSYVILFFKLHKNTVGVSEDISVTTKPPRYRFVEMLRFVNNTRLNEIKKPQTLETSLPTTLTSSWKINKTIKSPFFRFCFNFCFSTYHNDDSELPLDSVPRWSHRSHAVHWSCIVVAVGFFVHGDKTVWVVKALKLHVATRILWEMIFESTLGIPLALKELNKMQLLGNWLGLSWRGGLGPVV